MYGLVGNIVIKRNERLEIRLDTEILERIDNWRSDRPDLPSRSEAIRRFIEAGLGSSEGEKLFQTARFNLLVASKITGPDQVLSDAYVFAWYAKVYPILHDGADLHQPFERNFRVTREMMDRLTEHLDEQWRKNKVPTFYKLEDHYKVRSSRSEWVRGALISACRYMFLEEAFDETFWSALLQGSDHPSEAKSITKKFESEQIYLN